MKKIDITPQELCERLFKGESFYDSQQRRLYHENNCFWCDTKTGHPPANINNWFAKDIYTKPHWTDNLSEENPVLCWVWEKEGRRKAIAFICVRSGKKFHGINGAWWDNAEPVKLEDACIWEGE